MSKQEIGDTILLADDNPAEIKNALRMFVTHNIVNNIFVCHNGKEAYDFLFGESQKSVNGNGKLPIMAMIDYSMPLMNGLELLDKIRADKHIRTLPTVILVSSKEEQQFVENQKPDSYIFICKPVEWNQFTKSTKLLGLSWQVTNNANNGQNRVIS